MNEDQPILEVRDLTKTFSGFPALAGLNLQLGTGQVVGLLGENGCGKTTLLKILAGVLQGYSGHVRINGMKPSPETKAIVSFLPDTSFLANSATIPQCIDLYRDFFADFDPARTEDLLDLFALPRDKKLSEMSKGMREKVQIALAMGRQARIYLLDEPISGVDPAARDVLLQAITRHLDSDSLVLISTHLIHDLEPILDSIVMMRAGRVILTGQVDDLRGEHGLSMDQLFRKVYQ